MADRTTVPEPTEEDMLLDLVEEYDCLGGDQPGVMAGPAIRRALHAERKLEDFAILDAWLAKAKRDHEGRLDMEAEYARMEEDYCLKYLQAQEKLEAAETRIKELEAFIERVGADASIALEGDVGAAPTDAKTAISAALRLYRMLATRDKDRNGGPKSGLSPAEAFAVLREAAGGAWDGVDVEAYRRRLWGCDDDDEDKEGGERKDAS